MAALLAGGTMIVLLAGCAPAVGGGGDRAASAEPAEAVAALTDAHDALVRFDRDVAAAPEAAADWPDVAATVDDAVAADSAVDDLERRHRSALIGFRRGLQVARDAYAEVAAVAVDGGDVDEARTAAHRRLRALGNLRDALPG